jgi:hypothetical protein
MNIINYEAVRPVTAGQYLSGKEKQPINGCFSLR